ncbi:MAG: hypothetical protein AB7P20_03760 [Rhizobiaceae bacterium]
MNEQSSGQDGNVPNGYRQAIVTAITVILAFSLYFLRFWSLEAEGHWTGLSLVAAIVMLLSILAQMVALWRSLQISDDNVRNYAKTLRWFMAGVVLALLSVVSAAIDLAAFSA